jgi:hypothetical protein
VRTVKHRGVQESRSADESDDSDDPSASSSCSHKACPDVVSVKRCLPAVVGQPSKRAALIPKPGTNFFTSASGSDDSDPWAEVAEDPWVQALANTPANPLVQEDYEDDPWDGAGDLFANSVRQEEDDCDPWEGVEDPG